MICCFCSTHVENDSKEKCFWADTFWTQGREFEGPVCPTCSVANIDWNPNFQGFELKKGNVCPDLAIPYKQTPMNAQSSMDYGVDYGDY